MQHDRILGSHPFKQGIALRLQDTANEGASAKGTAANDFLCRDVNLPPSSALEKTDRASEDHRFDACPENGTLAHGTGLGSAGEDELRAIAGGAGLGQPVDGVDLTMPDRVDLGAVPALRQNLASDPIHDQRTERKTWVLLPDFDGSPHVVFVREDSAHGSSSLFDPRSTLLTARSIAAADALANRFWTRRTNGYPSRVSKRCGRENARMSYQTSPDTLFHSTRKRSSPVPA